MQSFALDGTAIGLPVGAEKGKPLAAPAPLRRKFIKLQLLLHVLTSILLSISLMHCHLCSKTHLGAFP
jgi:hypothetical protein